MLRRLISTALRRESAVAAPALRDDGWSARPAPKVVAPPPPAPKVRADDPLAEFCADVEADLRAAGYLGMAGYLGAAADPR